ncbi:MAG TPA: class I SAM-dependent methyltransferase [Longimicrobiaceae bacterium]
MSRFGSNPLEFFDSVYRGEAPWDVGGPQPALASLLADHPPMTPVLDVGCGSGDLAIHLAESGFEVVGVDFVEEPIAQAREKAARLPAEVAGRLRFEVADALHPSRLGLRFGAVVDSGFYHLFDPRESEGFVDELAMTLLPGGRYYLLAFAVEFPVENVPRAVTEAELRERFSTGKGWHVVGIEPSEFLSRVATVPAIRGCFEYRTGAPT